MSLARRTGLRLALECVVIVAAAAIAGVLRAGPWGIGAAVFLVWLVAAVVEHSLARPEGSKRRAEAPGGPVEEPAAAAEAEAPTTPLPAGERVRVLPPAAAREPEPEPEPAPAPAPEPEPTPQPEPQPEPVASAPSAPQRWNVWEIERAMRASGGSGGEEREFLILYLREYADPAGLLPVDFDSLVRESFGDLVGATAG